MEFRRNTCDTSVMAHPMECPSSHYPEPYLRRPPPSLHLARLLNRCWLWCRASRSQAPVVSGRNFRAVPTIPISRLGFRDAQNDVFGKKLVNESSFKRKTKFRSRNQWYYYINTYLWVNFTNSPIFNGNNLEFLWPLIWFIVF